MVEVKPHFYIVKGRKGVYLFFLFLIQNIDTVCTLEQVPTVFVLSKNKIKFHEIFDFYS